MGSTAKILVSLQQSIASAEKVLSSNRVLIKSISNNVNLAQLQRAVDNLSQGASEMIEVSREYITRFKATDKVKNLQKAEELEKKQNALFDDLYQAAKRSSQQFKELLVQINNAVDPQKMSTSGTTHQQLEKIRNEIEPLISKSAHMIKAGIDTLTLLRSEINLPPVKFDQAAQQKEGEKPVLKR